MLSTNDSQINNSAIIDCENCWKVKSIHPLDLRENNTTFNEEIKSKVTKSNQSDSAWDIYKIEEITDDYTQNSSSDWKIKEVKEEFDQTQDSWKIKCIEEKENILNENESWRIRKVEDKTKESQTSWKIQQVERRENDDLSKWQITSINVENRDIDSVSIASPHCDSLLVEEWDEYQVKTKSKITTNVSKPQPVQIEYIVPPVSNSSIQIDKEIHKTRPAAFVHVANEIKETKPPSISSQSSQCYMEDSWYEVNKSTNQNNYTFEQEMQDHYNYQYAPEKTTKLLQQTISDQNLKSNFSLVKRIEQPKNLVQTNCLKQKINVEHCDEELLDHPDIRDASGQLINSNNNKCSVNSILEKVNLTVEQMQKAIVIIEITVEMFYNFQPKKNLWKRKEVKLTREINLDLSLIKKDHYKTQLETLVTTLGKMTEMEKKSPQGQLLMKQLFASMLNLVRQQEQENSDWIYLTKQPDATLTEISYQPTYLMHCSHGNSSNGGFLGSDILF